MRGREGLQLVLTIEIFDKSSNQPWKPSSVPPRFLIVYINAEEAFSSYDLHTRFLVLYNNRFVIRRYNSPHRGEKIVGIKNIIPAHLVSSMELDSRFLEPAAKFVYPQAFSIWQTVVWFVVLTLSFFPVPF